jgi:hypothetical protein
VAVTDDFTPDQTLSISGPVLSLGPTRLLKMLVTNLMERLDCQPPGILDIEECCLICVGPAHDDVDPHHADSALSPQDEHLTWGSLSRIGNLSSQLQSMDEHCCFPGLLVLVLIYIHKSHQVLPRQAGIITGTGAGLPIPMHSGL